MTGDLFADQGERAPWAQSLGAATTLLHGFALDEAAAMRVDLGCLIEAAPWRQMVVPGGRLMSVAMSNCGALGWVSDRSGYRYSALDPLSGRPWPPMPESFLALARSAAAQAGFADFAPDACLINRYQAGTRLSLHQDKDERDFSAPIVSVSLGLPAVFLLGGATRTDRTQRVALVHGDVLVWGGPDRLRYHGVLALKPGQHPLFGEQRINLTFRRAA